LGGFTCAETPASYWDSPHSKTTLGEEEIKKHEYWRAKFEEGAREMRAIEGPKLRRLPNTYLEAQIKLLNRRINIEEARSCGSRLHVKLLQDFDEALSTWNMRDMQASTAMCMETIAMLEREIKLCRVELAKQYEINTKMTGALRSIRDNTEKEISKAWS
jgi:hypothetical protein